MNTRQKVAELHAAGHGTTEIAKLLGLAKASISYHKAMLGVAETQGHEVDWDAVAEDVGLGMLRDDILKKHRIGAQRLTRAIRDGQVPKRKTRFCPSSLCESSPTGRKAVKQHILENSLLPHTCALCPQGPTWHGRPLVLVLDHINGVNNDHRLSNLRFLCPNCNSQTETFAGRNIGRDNVPKRSPSESPPNR